MTTLLLQQEASSSPRAVGAEGHGRGFTLRTHHLKHRARGLGRHLGVELGGKRFRFMKTAETVSGARTFAEAYDDIEANVRREKAKAAHAAWVERLRADNYIKIY